MATIDQSSADSRAFRAEDVTRPDRALLKYYLLCSLLSGPLFPLVFVPLVCKYMTLRYAFDAAGVSVRWGVLFRREVYLTYRRIQDIHLTANIVQRWLGLASLGVQTASGSATPELTIEGVLQFESLRDVLYRRMRGVSSKPDETQLHSSPSPDADKLALSLLTEIRDALQKLADRDEGKTQ